MATRSIADISVFRPLFNRCARFELTGPCYPVPDSSFEALIRRSSGLTDAQVQDKVRAEAKLLVKSQCLGIGSGCVPG
jgi:hypothetical protein